MASWIRSLKEDAGAEHTVVLDIGDHIDRMRPETEGTEGMANVAVLNASGYDAITLGNNEGLTYTSEVLEKLYGQQAKCQVVLANLLERTTGDVPSWMKRWHILEKSGIRIGLVGVTAPFTEFYRLLGWDVTDPFDAVREAVHQLRPITDVIIVMSHLGIRSDERLAEEIPGIHVILGGHTHHLLTEPLYAGGAWICATGKFGQYVGSVDLQIDRSTGKVELIGTVVHPSQEARPDPELLSIVDAYRKQSKEALSREVVTLDRDMPADWYGESPLGNLLAEGLRERAGAQIGLVNAGQLLGGPPQGPVTAGSLLQLCPSPINPCRMTLTGEQIWQALEESLLPEFMGKPLYGFGFRGKVLGTLCLAGIVVEYDHARPPYSKLVSVFVGNEQLQLERSYSVGTIDMFTFGIGYMSIGQGTDVEYYLPEFIRDILLERLRSPQALAESALKRWRSMPV